MGSRGRKLQQTIAAVLIALTAVSVRAQDLETAAPAGKSVEVEQVLYKGVVGNVLEAVPMDAGQRVQLQKTNAVVSNAMAGRSLALLLGIASPALLIGGLVWGILAASRIKAAPAVAQTEEKPGPPLQEARASGHDAVPSDDAGAN